MEYLLANELKQITHGGNPPTDWGDKSFTNTEELRDAHKTYMSERDNFDTLKADIAAMVEEKTQLIAEGRHESRERLMKLTGEIAISETLIERAEERALNAERGFLVELWGAWRWLGGRAHTIAQEAIAQRRAEIKKCPQLMDTTLPLGEVQRFISDAASNWGPLEKLNIDQFRNNWRQPIEKFEQALILIDRIEKDPKLLTKS